MAAFYITENTDYSGYKELVSINQSIMSLSYSIRQEYGSRSTVDTNFFA